MALIVCLAIGLGFFAGAFTIAAAGLYLENRAADKKLQKELQTELDNDKTRPTILQYAR